MKTASLSGGVSTKLKDTDDALYGHPGNGPPGIRAQCDSSLPFVGFIDPGGVNFAKQGRPKCVDHIRARCTVNSFNVHHLES